MCCSVTVTVMSYGVEVTRVCDYYYQPSEPQTRDHPGVPAEFYIEKVTLINGVDVTDKITESEMSHLEHLAVEELSKGDDPW